ncbi:MAG: GGDEF domain-containing protein [Planctomycetes bacterium]|nr:GGDEF domain-containing protein [Planctomycetota bacterium]
MESLAYIAPWVFGSIGIGLVAGFFAGRTRTDDVPDTKLVEVERQATLKVLTDLLKYTEQISTNVACHNSEMQETADHMGNLEVGGEEMESVKQALLGHVTGLMASNKQLQDDLTYSSCRIEEQALQIDHARQEARTDPLTTVSNRKAFDEKFLLLHSGWERDNEPYALILLDLDQFKRINDSHGHQAGDRVLEKVGACLKEWVREGDFVGRYGGDEFAILLPHAEIDVAMSRAETIRERTADETSRMAFRGGQVSVSVSIGVAAPREDDTMETVLHRADQALYKSKRLGRNQVNCEERDEETMVASA